MVNQKVKKEILERDGYRCYCCEAETNLVVHHILPRAFGGNNKKDNLITLCNSCNLSKDMIIHSYFRNDFKGDQKKITKEFCQSVLDGTPPKRVRRGYRVGEFGWWWTKWWKREWIEE